MTDNELLLAISNLMDKKLEAELQPIKNDLQHVKNDLQHVKNDIQYVKNDLQHAKNDIQHVKNDIKGVKVFQENVILPRLDTIESCYTDTYDRYKDYSDKMDAAFADIEILKMVVAEHSKKLEKIG